MRRYIVKNWKKELQNHLREMRKKRIKEEWKDDMDKLVIGKEIKAHEKEKLND